MASEDGMENEQFKHRGPSKHIQDHCNENKINSITKTSQNVFHFGGHHCAPIMVILIPIIVLTIQVQCSKESCTVFQIPPFPSNLSAYFDFQAVCIFLGWITFQVFLFALPIGKVVQGEPIPNGKRLNYRLNGFFAFVTTLCTLGMLTYLDYPLEIIPEKFLAIHVTAVIFCYSFSLLLYIKSFTVPDSHLNPQAQTGHYLYDFFMGRELNPRIGKFDVKVFLELRPGLIGWVAINLAFLITDYKTSGSINPTLLLCTFGQFIYVFDALYFEEAVLTTMDITTDGLGLMLVYGDLTFVPFVFTMTPRFIFEHHYQLPGWALIPLFIMTCTGYTLFRVTNSQKDLFIRNPTNPSVKDLKVIHASEGRRLLVDGWWGWVRHPNYFADILTGLSWCLTSGFSHILPYVYSMYHITILTHRSIRDDDFCRQNFEKAWDTYCKQVKYRIFKHIF